MNHEWIRALIGGAIIGGASGLLLFLNGRIFGVSGIVGGVLSPRRGETAWRVGTVAGLLAGGLILAFLQFDAFDPAVTGNLGRVATAGFLVGYGTRLGSGCTSGHGICGISRFSRRSIAATLTFLAVGIVTATAIGSR